MEGVAAVASIATLAEVALKSYLSASQLAKTLQNAPKEFSRIARQLEILHCELILLADIERQASESDDLPLLATETAVLERALVAASELISSAYQQLDKLLPQGHGPKARLQWAIKDKSQVRDLLSSLAHAESSLSNVLLLVNVRLSSFSWKVASSMRESQRPVSFRQNERLSNLKEQTTNDLSLPRKTLPSLFDRNPQAWNKFYGSWRSPDTSLLAWLGFQLTIATYGNDLHTTLFFSGKWRLQESPGAKAIIFNLGLRVFPLANLGFSILRGGLTLKSVVPETSELMSACRRGDVLTVKTLFASRKATPYDVTPFNSSPLRYAIESGSLEMVKFLCYHGADVNATFGRFETSPLEWGFRTRQIEIARFFLTQGASLDYLCYRGWTPVMLLFQEHFPEVPNQFFELLSSHSFTDFDVQDRYGTTALHRAAMWGTAQDVHALLQLGASPSLTDTEIGWTPIFGAASTNNIATLRRLAECMPVDFIHLVDLNGWTILHVAIQAGGLETMALVLDMGADPHQPIMVKTGYSGTTEEITPVDFALAQGENTYRHLIEALQIAGYGVSTAEDTGEEDVFWDAPEHRSF